MTTNKPPNDFVEYQPIYSAMVLTDLKALLARAKAAGVGQPFLNAAAEIHRLLRIYPQFGEPLRNLSSESMQIWLGTVPPLVIQYVCDDVRRVVYVVVPIRPLPNSGVN